MVDITLSSRHTRALHPAIKTTKMYEKTDNVPAPPICSESCPVIALSVNVSITHHTQHTGLKNSVSKTYIC